MKGAHLALAACRGQTEGEQRLRAVDMAAGKRVRVDDRRRQHHLAQVRRLRHAAMQVSHTPPYNMGDTGVTTEAIVYVLE